MYRVTQGYKVVPRSIDLLEHDQWQPRGDDVAHLDHTGYYNGSFLAVSATDLVGPASWMLVICFSRNIVDLREIEPSKRSTNATKDKARPFPAVINIPNCQGGGRNDTHKLLLLDVVQQTEVREPTAPNMMGGQRRPLRTVSDIPADYQYLKWEFISSCTHMRKPEW
jgi:hypothetical protein